MYKLAVKRDFIAQHFLVGGDWGPENQRHSHHYRIEIQLEAMSLDQHGFLVDIVEVKEHLKKLVAYYQDCTLNELAEFKDLNPSIENLANISYRALYPFFHKIGVEGFTVEIWEDDIAWVSYQEE